MKYPRSRILLFCKTPEAGKVKTRLIPELGAEGALNLHRTLAARIIKVVEQADLCELQIWCSGDIAHPFFKETVELPSTRFHVQQGSDLGERMLHASNATLAEPNLDSVILIGTDCPDMDAGYLQTALQKLEDHDAVLGPAEDGGYVLLGLRDAGSDVFDNIEWGSRNVCEQTCRRLNDKGWNWSLLSVLWDVDRPADLQRLKDKADIDDPMPPTSHRQ